MDAAKAKELKKYTRELLRDHETLSRNLAAAEALAAERQAELDKLQTQAERAPEAGGNNYLFGELCRVKERAQQSEVEARRLSVKLDVAKDLRAVDARARSPRPSRASGAALLWRSTASRRGAGRRRARAELANRRVDDERRRLLEALEAAADAARRAHRGAAYRNGDGAALRLVEAVEAALRHRVARSDGGFGPFLLDAARACSRLEERRDAQDAVLVACARAKDAAVPPWLETIGWGRGRLVLLELLNRAPCSTTKAARSSSTPVRARADAVAALEAAGVAFQLRHARHAVERLRDAAAPAAAAAEAPDVDDEAASTATGRRVADRGPASLRSARTARSRTASSDAPPPAAWPSPRALAALRRRAKTARRAPTRRAVAVRRDRRRGRVGVHGASRARGMDCEVRLRDGPDDHVVVLQWQSRSRKLTWAFEAADDGSSLFRPSSLSPPASPSRRRTTTTTARGRRRGARGATAAAAADSGAALLRTRTARFRVAAMDARRFHDVALAKAAATANAAGWALAELRDDPPDDAASHAAARLLADAAAFGDLEEAVRRVFGDDGAPHFVF
ncbi:ATPase [Aureococcus anophagefferens]|nr:ATPase [Aureococcus anophagefferens]